MNALVTQLLEGALNATDRARSKLAENPRARSFVYQIRNRKQFASLRAHDIMLADRVRLDAYEAALRARIRPGDVVVDLGTGTGVLALMAARHARQVHAIEHAPIIEAAKAVARANGVTNIEFHNVHSKAFTLPEPADAIVHEQIGSAVFTEMMVPNIADLRDRVLKPGGQVLPGRIEMFVEPVELRAEHRSPPAWQQRVHGFDFSALRAFAEQQPFDYWYKLYGDLPLERYLTRPEPVVAIDLATARPSDLPNRIAYERPAIADGSLDGFCVYFTARFDDEISFTSAPDAPPTSWQTPFLRVESRPVRAGEIIRLDLRARELANHRTWRWR
jgi:protein arginine N-methyltransferase 1